MHSFVKNLTQSVLTGGLVSNNISVVLNKLSTQKQKTDKRNNDFSQVVVSYHRPAKSYKIGDQSRRSKPKEMLEILNYS
jgi:hypothetical protein